MQYIATVTQKGQVTIPKKLRDEIKIKLKGRVRIEEAQDHIKIYPDNTPDIMDLAGKFKAPKGVTALKAREEMEVNYTKYDKKLLERL